MDRKPATVKKTDERANRPFPSRLRALLADRNVSQIDLAKHLGISRQAVSKYCYGVFDPGIDKLPAIAAFLQVSTDYLLGRDYMDKDQTRLEFQKVTNVLGEAFRTLSENAKDLDIQGQSAANEICIGLTIAMFPIIEKKWAEYQLLKKQFGELIDEMRYKRRAQDEAN